MTSRVEDQWQYGRGGGVEGESTNYHNMHIPCTFICLQSWLNKSHNWGPFTWVPSPSPKSQDTWDRSVQSQPLRAWSWDLTLHTGSPSPKSQVWLVTLYCKTTQTWCLVNMKYKHSKVWLLRRCLCYCRLNFFSPTSAHPLLILDKWVIQMYLKWKLKFKGLRSPLWVQRREMEVQTMTNYYFSLTGSTTPLDHHGTFYYISLYGLK